MRISRRAGDLLCPVGKTPLYLGQPGALLIFDFGGLSNTRSRKRHPRIGVVRRLGGWGGRIRTRDRRRFFRGIVVSSSVQTDLVFFQLKRMRANRWTPRYCSFCENQSRNGMKLVVMTAVGERQEFAFEIRQPRSLYWP
jgi:hypothetical protein